MVTGLIRETTNITGIPRKAHMAWRKNVAKKFPSFPRAEPTNEDDKTITRPKTTKNNTVATMTTYSADSSWNRRFTLTTTRGLLFPAGAAAAGGRTVVITD
jgi:hypothetical protein